MNDLQQLRLTTAHLESIATTPGKGSRKYRATILAEGELQGHGLIVEAPVLQRDHAKFDRKPAFLNHSWWPRVENLVGLWTNVTYTDTPSPRITADLTLKSTPQAQWLTRVIDEIIDDQSTGNLPLPIGLSADVWFTTQEIGDNRQAIATIHKVESVDIVVNPASDDARFERILASAGPLPATNLGQTGHTPTEAIMPNPEPVTPAALQEEITSTSPQVQPTTIHVHAAQLPVGMEDLAKELADLKAQLAQFAKPATPAQPTADPITEKLSAIEEALSKVAAAQVIKGFDTPRSQPLTAGSMTSPQDMAASITDWQFGVPGAPTPEPAMRSPRAFYHALTGDFDFHGVIRPAHARFANATTTSLADLAANAMNKVMVATWPALDHYRWFEDLVTVAPNNGTVYDMAWISFGGIANLPSVSQGGTYTELTVADSKESDAFTKYGGYVGVTVEMYRNDDLQRMQAIPRALAVAAVRTRSSYLAAVFTSNAGVGPTLDDDSTALFHSNHGSNVQTTALTAAAWQAARTECFKMSELGSSKRLGLYPKYCLIPVDLYETALIAFGYGAGTGGYPGTGNNDVNPHAVGRGPNDPRPIPIVVPDWTDTNNWAYLVDPMLHPVLMMSYVQNPGGGTHPMPELFSVADPTAGLVFTNDVLPIKVRDWFAYGVAGWRGVGKRNVT